MSKEKQKEENELLVLEIPANITESKDNPDYYSLTLDFSELNLSIEE